MPDPAPAHDPMPDPAPAHDPVPAHDPLPALAADASLDRPAGALDSAPAPHSAPAPDSAQVRLAGARRVLRRLRPTTRRGALRLGIAGAGLVALLGVGAVGIAIAVPWAYGEYGFHPERNAQSWAALTPRYADSTLCQRCHTAEFSPWQAAPHAVVTCESCHGPLGEHAATAPVPATDANVVVGALPGTIAEPRPDLCVVCHERIAGRPAAFPQVTLAEHYGGATCRACHDPHTATAATPPDISHPLAKLPACVVCHAPAGLKPLPAGHVESPDAVCRSCHRAAGPGD